jgi:hypothetical protein
MLHRLAITVGDSFAPLAEAMDKRLVEARIEMELSRPTRFALRFEDELCEGQNEVIDFDPPPFEADSLIALFTSTEEALAPTECLVVGRITKLRSSIVVGGVGSWLEIHGEDKRVDMGKVAVQENYDTSASAAVEKIVKLYDFKPHAQETLGEPDGKKVQLVQSATDLAFIEDQARRNAMEFWLDYATVVDPTGKIAKVDITANFYTSPERSQQIGAVNYAILKGDTDQTLRLHPDATGKVCPNITKFDARIDFDKPTSVSGFAMEDDDKREAMKQVAEKSYPVDPAKDAVLAKALKDRKLVAPPAQTPLESQLAVERILVEQMWFVEVDCSASTSSLGYVVRPHMVIPVEGVGDSLSGSYQVKSATHVFTATDCLVDFTLRANGFKGGSNA